MALKDISLAKALEALEGKRDWSSVAEPDAPVPTTDTSKIPVPAIPEAKEPEEDDTQDEETTLTPAPASTTDDEEEPEEKEVPPPVQTTPSPATAQQPPLAAQPTKPAGNVIDLGQPSQNQTEGLKQALDQRNNAVLANQLGKAAELVGSGISGTTGRLKPTERTGEKLFESNIAQAENIPKDFQMLSEQEKKDPNSGYAQGLRDFMKNEFKIDVKGGTPEQLNAIAPMALKAYDAKQAVQARAEQYKLQQQLRMDALSNKKEQHDTDKQNQALAQIKSSLESARGNPEVSQALKDRYSASKALSLINKYDPDNLSPQQINLFQSEVAKIATGAVPTIGEMKALNQDTLKSKFAEISQKFLNKPTGANAGEFIKQYKDYLIDLNQNAQNVIKDKFDRVIESSKKQLGDENYNSLKDQYVKPFEMQQSVKEEPKKNEIERLTKDGRVAIFDADTKDFLRYK